MCVINGKLRSLNVSTDFVLYLAFSKQRFYVGFQIKSTPSVSIDEFSHHSGIIAAFTKLEIYPIGAP